LVVEVEAVAEPEYADEKEDAYAEDDVVEGAAHAATLGVGVEYETVSAVSLVLVLVMAAAVVAEQYTHVEQVEPQETPSSYVHSLH
jgi:hypothetical protein